MANNYPSPCDSCVQCTAPGGCERWRTRYLYRQKQINAFSRKLFSNETKPQTKFVYQHPDTVRRYLKDGPCKGCNAEKVCNTPCPAYLRWWDARMQIARKKVRHECI